MPYCKCITNVPLPPERSGPLSARLSAAVAAVTGKPERVVQVAVESGVPMLMAGTDEPTAHVEIKGIGFPERHARPLSEAICGILGTDLDIPGPRVYIAFDSYAGAMWGVNGGTY